MQIIYKPENPEVPAWMEDEYVDGVLLSRVWLVRLWTGRVMQCASQEAAEAEYWR